MSATTTPNWKRGPQPLGPLTWWPVLALLSLAATGFAWFKPSSHDVSSPRPYSTTYHFDYSAALPAANGVYEQTKLGFGDPIFRKVVDSLDVNVDFTVDSPGALVSDATFMTKVVVSSGAGWTRTLTSTQPAPFKGDTAKATIHVDFSAAEALAKQVQTASGVPGNVVVTVLASADAKVHLPGNVDGGGERKSLTVGSLVFDVNQSLATLRGYTTPSPSDQVLAGIDPGTATASINTGGSGTVNPVAADKTLATQSIVGMVNTTFNVPVTVGIGKWDVRVSHLRIGTLIALVLFAALCAYNVLVLSLARRRGESAYLKARYGARIFPLANMPDTIRDQAVLVGSFEGLAAAAVNADADILHQPGLGVDWYYVLDGPTVFAYKAPRSGAVVNNGAATAAGKAAAEPKPGTP